MKLKDNSTQEIDTALYQLEQRLKSNIRLTDVENSNASTAKINAVDKKLTEEVKDRQSADGKLQDNINKEIADRQEADAAIENAKQDKLIAGDNIQINGNIISATSKEYTAEAPVKVTDGIISLDTVPVNKGGTGVTTQADINKAFIGNLTVGNDNVTDGTEFVSSWASDNGFAEPSAINKPYKRQFVKVWNYIKDKISSVLGLTSEKVSSYDSHLINKDNPHSVTKSQVGLGSVVNTGDSATPVSGGTTKFTTGGAYTELNKKVDKVDGKGLSSNDFTDTYKDKLDNIDTTVTANSSNLVTSGAVATAISTAETNAKNLANATGTLPVANGGTGVTTQADINKAFIYNLNVGNDDVTDGTEFVSSYASDNGFSDTNAINKPYKRQFVKVWNYIKGKISSVLGLTSTNYSGNSATATIADSAKDMYYQNLDLSSFDKTKFYPVFCVSTTNFAEVAINSTSVVGSSKYNQNRIHFDISTHGWSDTPFTLNIREYACYDNNEITIGCIGVGLRDGGWAIWLRGGIKYDCYTRNCNLSLKTSDYTYGDETYTVGTNYYGGTNTNVKIEFTPQSTITIGAYSSRPITAPGIKATINFIGDLKGNVTGNVTGNVSGSSGSCTGKSAKSSFLDEYPGAGSTRLTSGNIKPKDSSEWGGMRKDVVTASMTDGSRPGQDGHLLTMFWDNTGRFDTQFYISNDGNHPGAKIRWKSNGADYGPWTDIITSDNIGSQTVAKAASAGTADSAKNMYSQTLDLSALDKTKFYPIFCESKDNFAEVAIHSPSFGGSEPHNQNRIHFDITTFGWNDVPYTLNIREYACFDNSEITIGCIGRGFHQGGWAIWLRGGFKYSCWTRNCELSLKTSDYTFYDEKYTVGTNYYGGTNTNVSIIFTPQSTITDGAYSSRNIVAPNITSIEQRIASLESNKVRIADKNLAVNSSGNAVEWVKPQTIKFVDYKTGNLTFNNVGDQKKIELSNFGPDVTENNVLSFMVIYCSGVKVIAQAGWAKSQGTGSSGLACALHSLNTGTGYAVIRCVYLA